MRLIDRKNTIENLEQNIRWIEEIECHQFPGWGNVTMAMRDAAELLKEQEPQAVKIEKNAYNHEFYYCPRCDRGFEAFFRKPMFCDKCGQAVKWDETD